MILDEAAYDAWLDPATPAVEAKALLTARNLDRELQFRRVSRAVNSVKNQGVECIETSKLTTEQICVHVLRNGARKEDRQ